MNKFFTALILVYKMNVKLTITVSIIFTLLLSMLLYINTNMDSKGYDIPKTLAYTEIEKDELNIISNDDKIEGIEYSLVPPLEKENKILSTINLPYENNFKIAIENMQYIDGTNQIVLDNQNLINNGEEIKNFPIEYLNLPTFASKEGLNLKLEPYNIDHIIEGSFPTNKEEILIGETLANYYLNDYGLFTYEELIGEKIPIEISNCADNCLDKSYKVSGVYQTYDHTDYNKMQNESIFILPNNNYYFSTLESYGRQGVFVVFENKKEMENMINNSEYKWYTYKDYMFKNYKKILNIISIFILNSLLFLLLFKEFSNIRNILYVHNINQIYYYIIFLSPFIILNLTIVLLYITL